MRPSDYRQLVEQEVWSLLEQVKWVCHVPPERLKDNEVWLAEATDRLNELMYILQKMDAA